MKGIQGDFWLYRKKHAYIREQRRFKPILEGSHLRHQKKNSKLNLTQAKENENVLKIMSRNQNRKATEKHLMKPKAASLNKSTYSQTTTEKQRTQKSKNAWGVITLKRIIKYHKMTHAYNINNLDELDIKDTLKKYLSNYNSLDNARVISTGSPSEGAFLRRLVWETVHTKK